MQNTSTKILILALVALFVVVPIWMFRVFRPNTRFYIKGCVVATGELDGSNATYRHIVIGKRDLLYEDWPRFELRFEGGAVLSFPDTDIAPAVKLASGERESEEFSEIVGSETRELLLPECNILLTNDDVIRVKVGSFEEVPKIQIRTDQNGRWYSLPLSDKDLVLLFGTPDRLIDELLL